MQKSIMHILLLLLALSVQFYHAFADCESEFLRSQLGKRFSYPGMQNLAEHAKRGTLFTSFPGHPGARWVRFRFLFSKDHDKEWIVTIRNSDGEVLESYTQRDAETSGDGTVWTRRLDPSKGIVFDTWPNIPVNSTQILEYIAMEAPLGEKSYYLTAVPGVEKWQPS